MGVIVTVGNMGLGAVHIDDILVEWALADVRYSGQMLELSLGSTNKALEVGCPNG